MFEDAYSSIATSIGGLVTTAGGGILLAQAQNPDPSGIGSGTLVGGAGLVLAFTGILKGFWDDRKDQRQTDLAKYRIKHETASSKAIKRTYEWIERARKINPDLPATPELPSELDDSDS